MSRAHAGEGGRGRQIAARVGCADAGDVAACLRDVPAAKLTTAATAEESKGGSFFWPVAGGAVLPRPPLDVIRAGEHNRVPILLGSTTDEASIIIRFFDPDSLTSASALEAAIKKAFPGRRGEEATAVYRADAYASPKAAFQAALGDGAFTCPTRRAARAFLAGQTESVRRFEFAHALDDIFLRGAGASHGFDLFFLFENFVHVYPTPRERRLGKAIVGYWSRFAATGDPNGGEAPVWPTYDASTDASLMLQPEITTAASERTEACDFWDSLEPFED